MKGKSEIKYINPIINMETLFTYKHKCKNFYYYQCNKRPICKGKLKIKKKRLMFKNI